MPAAENLAARALEAFRTATGWDHPPLRLDVRKRIPVAAGLGGGSADAACALRLCAAASRIGDERLLHEIAASLGADVPAQLSPGRWLASGAGERLQALPDPGPGLRVLVLPSAQALSTARVYAHADELGPRRTPAELRALHDALARALADGRPLPQESVSLRDRLQPLLENDLQPAAISLCPSIAGELELLRSMGAEHVMVSGSGPTVIGFCTRAPRRASGSERVIEALPVGTAFGAARAAGDSTVRNNPE